MKILVILMLLIYGTGYYTPIYTMRPDLNKAPAARKGVNRKSQGTLPFAKNSPKNWPPPQKIITAKEEGVLTQGIEKLNINESSDSNSSSAKERQQHLEDLKASATLQSSHLENLTKELTAYKAELYKRQIEVETTLELCAQQQAMVKQWLDDSNKADIELLVRKARLVPPCVGLNQLLVSLVGVVQPQAELSTTTLAEQIELIRRYNDSLKALLELSHQNS